MNFLRIADGLSTIAAFIAQILIIVLAGAMLFEVFSRYVFNSPTSWAFDISYMALGSAFVLGIAWTLKIDGHVRIDFFSDKLSRRAFNLFTGIVYLFVVTPVFAAFAWQGWRRTIRAFQSGEVETVSIWAPLMWPFYAAIALGLSLFVLQLIAQSIRYLSGQIQSGDHHS